MAKTKTKGSNDGFMTGAAEVIGGALGTIAGTITRLRADHPHPVEEAKEALAAGRDQLTDLAADAKKRTSAAVESARIAVAKVRKPAVRARRTGSKTARKAKQAIKKTVKRGKKAVRRPRKTAARRR